MKDTRLFMIIAMVGMMVTGCHPPTVEEVLTESYKFGERKQQATLRRGKTTPHTKHQNR